MRHLILAFGLLLTTSLAHASGGSNGNFRRTEVVSAVGVKPDKARVVNLTTAAQKVKGAKLPANAHILMVEHLQGERQGKVEFVKAPLDPSKPVEVMSANEVHRAGLITQAEATELAKVNDGRILGGNGVAVRVKRAGMSRSGGSFRFTQNDKGQLIERTVPVTGETGETGRLK
jgi:hypothetical protein